MTKLVACTSYKGGVGKSSTVLNIASGLEAEGFKTAILDLDPQGSLVLLSNREDANFTDVYPDENDLLNKDLNEWGKLKHAMREFDYIVVDHPALTLGAKLSHRFDVVLVCTEPTQMSFAGSLRGFRSLSRTTKYCAVVSRYKKNVRDHKDFMPIMAQEFGTVFTIPETTTIQSTSNRSESVFTTKDRYANKNELKAAYQEIINFIKG